MEKNIFTSERIAQTIETRKTLLTISFTYKEKKVSPPSPRPKRNKNRENDTILIENGVEKNSF